MKNKQVDKEKHDLEGGLIVLGPNDRIVNNDADELVCEFRFSKGVDNDDWVESTEMMPPLSSKHHHKRCQPISAMKYDPPAASEESSLLV